MREREDNSNNKIAIVGIGCRFPGNVNTPGQFWDFLKNGKNGVVDVPDERWNTDYFYDPSQNKKDKISSKKGGFIDDIDKFDAAFFGFSAREAESMDPQQRLLLKATYEAIEDAGLTLEFISGKNIGVFVGISSHDYSDLQQRSNKADIYTNTGNALSIAANRISYFFDFSGPSFTVDTACSSSLVALHQACESIKSNESSMALLGGVNLLVNPNISVGFSRAGMLSPEGLCRSFDADGKGYVRSEGVGAILLKPLKKALEDNDDIYAVIEGTGVNQDGKTNGITLPNPRAQEDLLLSLYNKYGINTEDVSYIEAHGTGTLVGDPIELNAIGNVLGKNRKNGGFLRVGSVKSNIGHLEPASGIAGLIKLALCLKHKKLVPNLHFNKPNPNILFDKLKLKVQLEYEDWGAKNKKLLAGINSFGFGGTNSHAILSSVPPIASLNGKKQPSNHLVPIPITAKNNTSLDRYLKNLKTFINNSGKNYFELPDLLYTLGVKKTQFDMRTVICANSVEDLTNKIDICLKEKETGFSTGPQRKLARIPKVVFVFSGQGPQWWGMGRELIKKEPLFQKVIQQCDKKLQQFSKWSLWDELHRDESESRINQTDIAQPAIFAIQVALAELWRSWGIKPDVVVGHSVGEVSAAYFSGIYSFEEAIKVIYYRSLWQHSTMGTGRMLAANLNGKEAQDLVKKYSDIVVAAINSPVSVTFSGNEDSLKIIAEELNEKNIFNRFLAINYAFHSPLMDPIKEDLLSSLKDIKGSRSKIPIYSTVTGKKSSGKEWDNEYWWKNVRDTVQFEPAIQEILDSYDNCLFLEISPHPVLTNSLMEIVNHNKMKAHFITSIRRKEDEQLAIYRSLGALFTLGFEIVWTSFCKDGDFIKLPTYAWDESSYWLEPVESKEYRIDKRNHPFLGNSVNHATNSWKSDISLESFPFLKDHQIQGSTIFPGAGYVEFAFALMNRLKFKPVVLSDFSFHKALFIQEEKMVSVYSGIDPVDSTFRLFSINQEDSKGDYDANCSGVCKFLTGISTPKSIDIPTLRETFKEIVPVEKTYRYFRGLGYEYGEQFRGIQELRKTGNEIFAKICINQFDSSFFNAFNLHPSYLDSSFQTIFTKFLEEESPPTYLPTFIQSIELYRKPTKTVWAHTVITKETASKIESDIRLYTNNGEAVCAIKGLRVEVVDDSKKTTSEFDWFYKYEWEELPLGKDRNQLKLQGKTVLVFDSRNKVSNSIVSQLAVDNKVVSIFSGKTFKKLTADSYVVDPENIQDVSDAIKELFDTNGKIDHIIYLWGFTLNKISNQTSGKTILNEYSISTNGLLHILKTFSSLQNNSFYPKLWLLTHKAQQVLENEVVLSLPQSTLWGFGRVIANEMPEYKCTLVDLENDCFKFDNVFNENISENEIACRQDQCFVRRLVAESSKKIFPKKRTKYVDPQKTLFNLEKGDNNSIDGLYLQEGTRSTPQKNEVEIQIKAAGLNFRDVMKAMGVYPSEDPEDIFLGDECSGIITKVGAGINQLKKGDSVIALTPKSYGSFITVSSEYVIKKPSHISYDEAAGIPIAFMTAFYALCTLGRLQKGERVLIHAASGGVGQAGIQIAQMIGAEIYATAGTKVKRKYLADLGIKHVYDSRNLDFADQIMEITNREGVDIVLNSIAGDTILKSIELLKPYGRFLEIGKVDIYQNNKIGLWGLRNNISFHAIDLAQMFKSKPGLTKQTLESVLSLFQQKKITPLKTKTFPIDKSNDAFRFMAQSKHIGKVVLTIPNSEKIPVNPKDEKIKKVSSNASYVIVGGYGGFGFETVKWLIENGAKNLFLLGRSGKLTEEVAKSIDGFKAKNINIQIIACDVTQSEEVRDVLKTIRIQHPPIKGIFHSAMVLQDGFILQLDQKDFQKVLNPKILGAWNLHQHSLDDPLDYFVCYSSVASLFGNPGQSNYVSANIFLDELSLFRRSLGLPSLTVNWGVISKVGYVSNHEEVSDILEKQGLKGLLPSQSLQILGYLLNRNFKQMGVIDINWKSLFEFAPHFTSFPKFQHMYKDKISKNESDDKGFVSELLKLSKEEQLLKIQEKLIIGIASVLKTSGSKLAPDIPLNTLGVDSLMAVELRNKIQHEFGLELTMMDFMQGPSIEQLSMILLEKFFKQSEISLPEEVEVGEI